MTRRVVMAYGGGTNSAAMLVGLWEKREQLDAIVLADTGSEMPHTYEHLDVVSRWCEERGLPKITVLRGSPWWQDKMLVDGSLEGECLRRGTLPSKAYGYSKCSMKWKVQPQIKWTKWYAEREGVATADITRLIGFDADEHVRRERMVSVHETSLDKEPWQIRFPLYEWGWGREECVEAIQRGGLPQPGKSACFFCPSSKKAEILSLREKYPELFLRAVEIERRAAAGEGEYGRVTEIAGLGRRFSWMRFVQEVEAEPSLPFGGCAFGAEGQPEIDCGCYDG